MQMPFGDVYQVQTPALDKLGDRLYAEQQRKEQLRYQANKQLDDEFARNLSGIRDADIGDLTRAYGDFKIANMELMKKRGGVSPEDQLGVLRKKAAIYDIINKSKIDKEYEDNLSKLIPKDTKGLFADDAQQQIIQRRSTPLSKLDRTRDENIFYKGSVPDFDKYNKLSFGTPTEVRGATKQNGLNDETPVYKVGNNPNVMYDTMLSNIVKDNKGRNAMWLINHSFGSDQEKQDLMNRYFEKIKDPAFIAAYGETKPFPQSAQTDLGEAVMLQTMRNIVDAPIPTPKIEVKVNEDRRKAAANAEWDRRSAIQDKRALNHIYVNASLQGKGGTNYTVQDLVLPDGTTDLTKPLQGINVNNIVNGKAFKSNRTVYNPKTKEITYHDVVDNKDYTIPASKFRQVINTINTIQDLKVYDNLIQSIDKAFEPPKGSTKTNRPPLESFIKKNK